MNNVKMKMEDMKMTRSLLFAFSLLLAALPSVAALPCIVYRGSLVETATGEWPQNVDRFTQTMHFSVYDTDVQGTAPLWKTPDSGMRVQVNPDGTFEAVLADETLAALITTGTVTHVGLMLGTAAEITPRRALRPVATATRALVAERGTSDMKIGTLSTKTVAAKSLSVGTAEVAGTLTVERGSVTVEPFTVPEGESTRLLRGDGVTVFDSKDPAVLRSGRSVSTKERIVRAPADGVALIHCAGSTLRIPGTILFCRSGDWIISPASANDVKVSFWEFAK